MKKRIAVLFAMGIYVLSPIDALPDFIPLVGQIDDALVGITGSFYVLWPLIRPALQSIGFVKNKEISS